jgi:hypothetical protein
MFSIILIFFKNKKNIILMCFGIKNILKNNLYRTPPHTLFIPEIPFSLKRKSVLTFQVSETDISSVIQILISYDIDCHSWTQ